MKILVISTWFPFPPNNGARTRTYNLLKGLGKKHTVDLLAISQMERDVEHLDEVKKFCRRVASFPPRQFDPDSLDAWWKIFSKTPRVFEGRFRPEMESLALRWNEAERYDASIAVTLGAAPYAATLDTPLKILDEHNVECLLFKRQSEAESSLIRKLRRKATWIKAERFERELASQFNLITVVSEPELVAMRNVMQDHDNMPMEVIPNGVNPDLFTYERPPKANGVIAFTGAMTYEPNHDCAQRLCRDILPRVRESLPDTQLRITGDCGNIDVTNLAGMPGVEFTGYVDDIRPIVASAPVLVVPLRYGVGTRLKILEAMALGTPVVSTRVGAEGLDLVDGENILLGESSEELAAQTVKILKDPALASRIANAALEVAKDRYQWPKIADKFEQAVSRLGAGRNSGKD